MANTGLLVAICLAMAALAGNWLWSRQARKEQIERLVSSVRAPDILKEHSKVFNKKEIIKVTPNIYCAIGYALANTIMIEGTDGIIIIDVTENPTAGREVLKDLRAITKKPVRAIIYTHNHADHTYGAKSFIEDPAHPPDIWAHQLIMREFQRWFYSSDIMVTRAVRQFGTNTPDQINSGIGFKLAIDKDNFDVGLVFPNKLFTGSERDISYAGVSMKLVHIPGETADQIGVLIPEQKVFLCADDVYRAFPNLYAIRGTPSRSLLDWAASLDRIIDLDPHYLVPSHTRPIEGAETIRTLLTNYRDAIQFVHDQTIRFMNKGLMPDEIVTQIHLPEQLATNPYLIELYGTMEWSIKGVFNTYIGWFSGDPVDLSPLTPDELARRYVELAGGIERCLTLAQEAFDKEDFRWGLTLSSHVIRVDSDNSKARQIASNCMIELGNQQISANGRNYFFTSALEVVGEVSTKLSDGKRRQEFIRIAPMLTLMTMLRVRFKAEECKDTNAKILFYFKDTKTSISLTMRNSIVLVSDRPNPPYQIKVSTNETTWREMTISRIAGLTSYASGDLQVEGGLVNFRNIMSCLCNCILQISGNLIGVSILSS